MISVRQVSRDQNHQRGRSKNGEREQMWEEIAEDQRQKSKVTGKQRQEVFSGSSEKSGNKEASQDSGRGVGGTSKLLRLVQGTAGSFRALKKVVPWSPQLILWLWLKRF